MATKKKRRELLPDTPEEMEELRKKTYRDLDATPGKNVKLGAAAKGFGRVLRYGAGGAKQLVKDVSRRLRRAR